jgi:hypothetical protein
MFIFYICSSIKLLKRVEPEQSRFVLKRMIRFKQFSSIHRFYVQSSCKIVPCYRRSILSSRRLTTNVDDSIQKPKSEQQQQQRSKSSRTKYLLFGTLGVASLTAIGYEFYSVYGALRERDDAARQLVAASNDAELIAQFKSRFTSFPVAYLLYKLENAGNVYSVGAWASIVQLLASTTDSFARALIANGCIDTLAILLPAYTPTISNGLFFVVVGFF